MNNEPVKVIIVEDEKPDAGRLKYLLLQSSRDFEIIKCIETVREAVQVLPGLNADLIFLDIHLADDICFRIFEQVAINTPVIFTTAYDQYAIKAFQLNSIDYLLKPVDSEQLEKALEKFDRLRQSYQPDTEIMNRLLEQLTGKPRYKQRFMIESGRKIKTVKTDEIAWFSSEEKNSFLTTFSGRSHDVEYSLDKLELVVDPDLFFRVSRKYLIHIEAISNIYYLSAGKIKLELQPAPPDDVMVSIRRVKGFKDWLEQ